MHSMMLGVNAVKIVEGEYSEWCWEWMYSIMLKVNTVDNVEGGCSQWRWEWRTSRYHESIWSHVTYSRILSHVPCVTLYFSVLVDLESRHVLTCVFLYILSHMTCSRIFWATSYTHVLSLSWVTSHFLEYILSHVPYVTLYFSILVDLESRHALF